MVEANSFDHLFRGDVVRGAVKQPRALEPCSLTAPVVGDELVPEIEVLLLGALAVFARLGVPVTTRCRRASTLIIRQRLLRKPFHVVLVNVLSAQSTKLNR